jgi:flagellar biosynthesis anti-sigma factor FlgM
MRIDLNNALREANEIGNEPSNSRSANSASTKTALGEDTAELSGDQVRVQLLTGQVNQLPEVRHEKVTALALAVRQGRYDVTPEQTAEAMLGEMQTRSAA